MVTSREVEEGARPASDAPASLSPASSSAGGSFSTMALPLATLVNLRILPAAKASFPVTQPAETRSCFGPTLAAVQPPSRTSVLFRSAEVSPAETTLSGAEAVSSSCATAHPKAPRPASRLAMTETLRTALGCILDVCATLTPTWQSDFTT